MRRLVIGLLVLILPALCAPPLTAGAGSGGIAVDGKELLFDVDPAVVDGVLMVPVRAMAEALQGQVSWDEQSQSATVSSGERTVVFTIGRATALLDGREVMLSGKVVKLADRTFVPASFLLIFYGSRLSITHPAVRDPKAVDLLLKSDERLPSDYDVLYQQRMHMTDGIVTIDTESDSSSQVRGEEMLMFTQMTSLMFPPGAGDMTVAIKNGKQYVKIQGAWQMTGPATVSDLRKQLSLTGGAGNRETIGRLILEAHLGESRTVNGVELQDVVVTFDMNRLFALFPELASAGRPAGSFVFERYTGLVTIETSTGAWVAQKLDMALVVTEEGRPIRVEMQADQRMIPNKSPIKWPEDLKE